MLAFSSCSTGKPKQREESWASNSPWTKKTNKLRNPNAEVPRSIRVQKWHAWNPFSHRNTLFTIPVGIGTSKTYSNRKKMVVKRWDFVSKSLPSTSFSILIPIRSLQGPLSETPMNERQTLSYAIASPSNAFHVENVSPP